MKQAQLVFYEEDLIAYFTLRRVPIRFQIEDKVHYTEALDLARLAVDTRYQKMGVGPFIVGKIKEIAYMTNKRYIQADALFE